MVSISALDGDTVTYTEGDPPLLLDLDSDAMVADAPNGFEGGVLTVAVTGNETLGEDLLGVDSGFGVVFDEGFVEGGAVFVDDVLIGVVAAEGGAPGEPISVQFNADATAELIAKLIRSFTYSNINNDVPSDLPRTITFTLSDADGIQTSVSVTVNVVEVLDVNDPPIVDMDNAADATSGTAAYEEQAAAVLLAPRAVVSDPDSPTINGGSLIVSVDGATAFDQLGIQNQGFGSGQIAVENGNALSEGGTIFATFAGGQNGQPLVVTFLPDGSVSTAASSHLTALYRAITYGNTSDAPPSTRTVTFTLNDGGGTADGGNDTNVETVLVSIAAVDDGPPVLDLNGADPGTGAEIVFEENDPATMIAAAGVYGDADAIVGASLTVAFTSGAQADDRLTLATTSDIVVDESTLYYQGVVIGQVTGGTDPDTPLSVTFDGNATRAAVEAVVRAVAFANGSDSPVPGTRLLSFTVVSDGASTSAAAAVEVVDVSDPPVAANDLLFVDEQTVLQGNVLNDNGNGEDFDPDGPRPAVTRVNGSALNLGQVLTLTSGATLQVNADGSFRYDDGGVFGTLVDFNSGAANAGATDSFTYTISGNQTATVTINVVGVTAPGERFLGSAADDSITGGNLGELFILSQGGVDGVNGGGGDDGFYFGGTYDGDIVVGGAGSGDQVGLQGDYAAGVTLDGGSFSGVEGFALLAGDETDFGDSGVSFYDYALNLTGAWASVTFNGNGLRSGEDFAFDASATSAGIFTLFGGFGTEDWTGGAGSDGFFFGAGRFDGALDKVDGGGGADDQVALRGDYAAGVTFVSGALTDIDSVVLLSSQAPDQLPAPMPFSYSLTFAAGNVAPSAQLTVTGASLLASEQLSVDGSAEMDGAFRFIGGAGADSFQGGAQDDVLVGLGGADLLRGNGGNDRFVYISRDDSGDGARDAILDFAAGDLIDLSMLDPEPGAPDSAFTFADGGAFSGRAGEVRLVGSDGAFTVEIDFDGDTAADMFITLATLDPGYVPTSADFIL